MTQVQGYFTRARGVEIEERKVQQNGKTWTETRDGRQFKIGTSSLGFGANRKEYIWGENDKWITFFKI